MATRKSSSKQERPPADKYSVRIQVGTREEVQPLVRERGLDLVQTAILDEDKRFRLTFYLTDDQIKALRKDGFEMEVGENVSERGLKRQTEVAKGDRFDGGRVPPKGLGVARDSEPGGPK